MLSFGCRLIESVDAAAIPPLLLYNLMRGKSVMANTKIAPVTVTVSFVCDEVTSVWEGREGSDLASKLAGFLDFTKAEIVDVSAATGEKSLAATAYARDYGKDRGRLIVAVEIPSQAAKAKAPAAKAKVPAAEDARIAALEDNLSKIMQLLQK